MWRWLVVGVVLVAGCGGESPTRRPSPEAPPRVAAPDAGTRAGHDAEPLRVRVPAVDRTAPQALLRLAGAQARSGGSPAVVRLPAPVLRPVAVGRDKQGMGRIRVSLQARIRCGDEVARLIRYFPGPGIERVRIPPGAVAPTSLTRRVRFGLRCPRGVPTAASGTLWADATSAWETESSSAPLHFSWRR